MLPFSTLVVNLMSELKLKFLNIRYLSWNFLIRNASVSLFIPSYSNKKCEKMLPPKFMNAFKIYILRIHRKNGDLEAIQIGKAESLYEVYQWAEKDR